MYSESEAKSAFLAWINDPVKMSDRELFEVKSIRLAPRKDYWIIGANSIDRNKQYGGSGGYLFNIETGEITSLDSSISGSYYLQDLYDAQDANGKLYVLVYDHESDDKAALIKIHKLLGLTYKQAILYSREKREWLRGKKSMLEGYKKLLDERHIKTKIILTDSPSAVVEVTDWPTWWSCVTTIFSENFNA